MRRVVITGIGIVSCLGNNQEEVHQSLLNSKSGLSFSEEYKEHNLKSHVHGKPKIKLEDHIDRKTIRFMGSGSAYNYIAMKEAIEDSGLEEKEISNFKTGIVMGSGGPSILGVLLNLTSKSKFSNLSSNVTTLLDNSSSTSIILLICISCVYTAYFGSVRSSLCTSSALNSEGGSLVSGLYPGICNSSFSVIFSWENFSQIIAQNFSFCN